MKNIYKLLMVGTAILVLLTSACTSSNNNNGIPTLSDQVLTNAAGIGTGTVSVVGTETTGTAVLGTTSTPLTTGTPAAGTISTLPAGTSSAAVPVTGGAATVICQFCLDNISYAIVALPQNSTFQLAAGAPSNAGLNCSPMDAPNGRQVVICYGNNQVTFNLSVCTNGNCVDFPVVLQNCPNARPGGSGTDTPMPGTTVTPGTGTTATPPPAVSPTATP